MEDIKFLKRKAAEIRKLLLETIYEAGTGHTGSSLSNTDILTVLYYNVMNVDPQNPTWEDRDRYIQSKGHAVESYWAVLADRGFFPKEELKTFSKFNSRLIGHPNNKVPGVEMNTGSLGHGLSVSVGMALAAKKDHKSYRVFTLMGDGELAEGSVWEAAMAASQYKLDNLIGIIDRNRLQITGSTSDVMSNEPLDKKWESFGWSVVEVNGNDIAELVEVLNEVPKTIGKPTIILANTIKGKGISLAENVAGWHHHVPTKEEYELAMKELSEQLEGLS
ncbi:transketolase [Bacillus sonorensis]|uniref:Transketolase domain-containing protein n=2 Tax=Bacillus sonorensis TaxID=119858 RepID=M5PC59_9BACI|nr:MULTISPECIES: transketolase [Bacillus]TWK78721.1 Transketolase 2 [Bacillus paralicheniformis]ASB91345.1 Transketolase [Bacillus sonorensis]EME72617.1 transketolase domain-containing protein [Bacillus sonorensis L12]MBG9917320.1 transketolase [Bacillus sonorensis]MCY8027210.1 transketolase [Bacillus sonorensis]